MGKTILEVQNLVKKFGELRALDEVSLDFPEKSITLIMGPNGSGKTTLINCITGVYKPDEGKIIYKGIDITGKPMHEIAKLGVVRSFQIPQLFRDLSVFEGLLAADYSPGEKFWTAFVKKRWIERERESAKRVTRIGEDSGLDRLDLYQYELSGGQSKIYEICKAWVKSPKLYLFDEPVGSISPVLSHKIFKDIQKVREETGSTFILVEHRLEIALKYVDYVYVLVSGKLACEGPPDEIIENPVLKEIYL